MNYLKYIFLFFSLQLGAQETLEFSNGDKWVGQVKEFNKEGLSLKSELTTSNLPFKVSNLRSIKFSKKNDSILKKKHTIHLTNGDILPGNLIGMNEKQLTIETTFAGVLILPKTLVKKIQYNAVHRYVQTAETLWPEQYSSEKTPLKLNAKYDFKHPTLIDITISGSAKDATFNLMGDNKSRNKYFSMQVDLMQYGNNLQAYGRLYVNGLNKRANKSIANVGNSCKMQVYINPEKGLFMLYVNGEEVAIFDFGDDFVWENRTMSISTNNSTLLNSFNVAKWTGNKPISGRIQFSAKDKAKINLRNGDVAWGTVTNINKEKLRFKSVLGDLSIPISSVSTVTLTNPVTPTQNNFTLSREDLRISGNISLKDEMLQVSNSYLSKAKLKKEHFRLLTHFIKARQVQRVKKLVTLSAGGSVIKATTLTLKNEMFEVGSNNLIGKQRLNTQQLTSIKFSGSNNRNSTAFGIQQRKSRRKGLIKNWTIELTNGDSFQTTKYSLEKDSLTFDLGQLPITVKRHEIQRISVNQKQHNNKDFLQSLPDRYSLHFSLDLSDDIIKAFKNNSANTYAFYMNSNSKTQRFSFNFYNTLKYASMSRTIAGNRKSVTMPIKAHNKMIIKNRNHMEVKFDHKKGLIEIWANKLLISSTGNGKTMEKFKSLYMSSNSRSGATTGPISFRPWDTINAKSYVIDKNMKVNEGTISVIDAKNITLGTNKYKLGNLSEIIFNNATANAANKKVVSITSRNGIFHVESLVIEDSKVRFKYGSNQKLAIPFDQLRNIKFIDKPSTPTSIK